MIYFLFKKPGGGGGSRRPYSHLHNGLHNGFLKTYLVMFEQDPKCRTQPIFGCLERAKAAAGEVCHLL